MPTRTTTYPARPRRGPLRSPLAAAPHSPSAASRSGASPDRAAAHAAVPDPRSVTLDEFDGYLRTVNNRDGRPYEEATINAYVFPAKALDAWMTANGLDGDFTTVDTNLLNRDFREYYQARGQGGTHTQQQPDPVVQLPAVRIRPPQPVRGRAGRRAAEAGYAQVTPHQFRHTFSDGQFSPPAARR